jgi:hypothetical protein
VPTQAAVLVAVFIVHVYDELFVTPVDAAQLTVHIDPGARAEQPVAV